MLNCFISDQTLSLLIIENMLPSINDDNNNNNNNNDKNNIKKEKQNRIEMT